MIPLFLGLTAANLLMLAVALTMGYLAGGGDALLGWHLLSGVGAAMVCIAVHSIVFTYFVATGKWVRHAIELKRLDPALALPLAPLRKRAMPAIMFAVLAVMVAAALGAIADSYRTSPALHHAAAWLAIGANAVAAVVEGLAIRDNATLIDRVQAGIDRCDAATPRP